MTVITMSRNELRRVRVLIDIADGRLSVADATGLIGVGRRQMYRLLDAFRARGPDGVSRWSPMREPVSTHSTAPSPHGPRPRHMGRALATWAAPSPHGPRQPT